MLSAEVERRLTLIQEDVRYLRDQMDKMRDQVNSIIWRVVAIGSGSGALGFVIALVTNKMLL